MLEAMQLLCSRISIYHSPRNADCHLCIPLRKRQRSADIFFFKVTGVWAHPEFGARAYLKLYLSIPLIIAKPFYSTFGNNFR